MYSIQCIPSNCVRLPPGNVYGQLGVGRELFKERRTHPSTPDPSIHPLLSSCAPVHTARCWWCGVCQRDAEGRVSSTRERAYNTRTTTDGCASRKPVRLLAVCSANVSLHDAMLFRSFAFTRASTTRWFCPCWQRLRSGGCRAPKLAAQWRACTRPAPHGRSLHYCAACGASAPDNKPPFLQCCLPARAGLPA